MKILDVYWFHGGGIVRVETDYDGIKYYINSFGPRGSSDEKTDMQHIADWGSTFPTDAGDVLFGVK
jgi:hypothetical protein